MALEYSIGNLVHATAQRNDDWAKLARYKLGNDPLAEKFIEYQQLSYGGKPMNRARLDQLTKELQPRLKELNQLASHIPYMSASDFEAAQRYTPTPAKPMPNSSAVSANPGLPATGGIKPGANDQPAAFNGLRSIDAGIQYDDKGRPMRNNYTAMTDNQGNLLSQFRMADKIGADVALDKTAMNTMQNRALSTGPSAWATMAEQKQRMEQQNALSQNNRMAAANTNRSYGLLAAKGGLSAGQRERLAMQGQRTGFQGAQGINNQGLLARQNIGLQDQQMKDQLLTQLPGMQLNAANFDQSQRAYRNNAVNADIANAMKDIQGYNAYQSGSYGDAMKEWAAAESSKAQAAAAKATATDGGGGLLGTIGRAIGIRL